ncbi:hypothetical protein N0Y54_30420 [Nostoc punctiforme UO1]|uniref:hypothetical protein n=1 Tax=Nostoc punctiforme TaxID=272131 RepID=UPI00309DF939
MPRSKAQLNNGKSRNCRHTSLCHDIQQSAERCHDSRDKEQFLVALAGHLQEANNFLLVSTVDSSVLVSYGLTA